MLDCYQIQSNSTNFLYVIFFELIHRLRAQQSDVQFKCPLPLEIFLNNIALHLEVIFELMSEIVCLSLFV